MNVLKRNNVHVSGTKNSPVIMYAHGFGCSQAMWAAVTPAFSHCSQQILFDYVGSGQSDISQYSFSRYADLNGYAQDILDICDALELSKDIIFVGHSVSCSIGILAANRRPGLFKSMILLGPSPCFLNMPPDYAGGFEQADLDGLIALMDQNYLGWANYLGPVVAGVGADPQIAGQLSDSFCSTDPVITRQFVHATFFADNRADFAKLTVPALILQHKVDALASVDVGQFVHHQIKNSQLVILDVAGHAAHMSHPAIVIDAMQSFLPQEFNC
ncbi:sigma factor SigB regulation protein RsbQ [Arsukibacterium ikkense]|uniref:Sigma factor SigB regulation protein RsbQ n=1 Tax=Arsukibacterium ikkense TaxID=336831 RepID=A0A0M2V9G1_9GAMM|nr:alpha/beta hydrolase [Arsukibacterium ikkense]KKO47231.1 sigma factor SigB regulation protein RsbQ [Arsukibacterium ikkense]